MHILKIIHGYPPNYNAGSEVYSHSVCNELAKTNRVSVFTREENPYLKDFSIEKKGTENPNLVIYAINNPNGKDGYRLLEMDSAFSCLLDNLSPDVAFIGHLNHLSTGLIDVLVAKRIPIVFILHDFWLMCPRGQFLTRSIGKNDNYVVCDGQNDSKCACNCYEVYFSGHRHNREKEIRNWSEWIHNRMETMRSIVKKCDSFIAPSRYLRKRFIDGFGIPKEKITYLDYGFDLSRFDMDKVTSPARSNSDTFTFGYIGTHIPAKGVNLLIDAFLNLKGDAKLKIFGRANGQSTIALRKMSIHAKDRIEFCGEYDNREIAGKVFANVDAIVVPSIWAENSPLVIHEAQACRIPVITANYGGMAEYVRHGINGLLFCHRDRDSLSKVMQWSIDHPNEMKDMGKRGYLFSDDGRVPGIEAHCERLMEIFRNAMCK